MPQPNPQTMIDMKKGVFDRTSRQDLTNAIDVFRTSKSELLVVHMHGGLVSADVAIKSAIELDVEYREAEATPLFFIWKTGILEVAENSWLEIAEETIFQIIRDRVFGFVHAKGLETIGATKGLLQPKLKLTKQALEHSAVNGDFDQAFLGNIDLGKLEPLTAAQEAQIQMSLKSDPRLAMEVQLVVQAEHPNKPQTKGFSVRASSKSLMSPEIIRDWSGPNGAKGILSIARAATSIVEIIGNVIGRYLKKTDHGLHATITEEILRKLYIANIGGTVWGIMKQYSEDAFGDDPEVFAGTAFLEAIRDLPSQKRILLVGHSAGSIFICNMLRAAKRMGVTKSFEVVLLAPAVRMDRFAEALSENGSQISNLRMFTMTDDNERKAVLVPQLAYFYPSSLLYFISGVLEDIVDCPLIGMQRFYKGSAGNGLQGVDKVCKYFSTDQKLARWSISDTQSQFMTNALDHGDFGHPSFSRNGVASRNSTFDSIRDIIKEWK